MCVNVKHVFKSIVLIKIRVQSWGEQEIKFMNTNEKQSDET